MVTVIYTALKVRIFSTVLYHLAEYIPLIERLCQKSNKKFPILFYVSTSVGDYSSFLALFHGFWIFVSV
jgi:hypothetical protein